jgi:hypothetical protein|tara:strand:- start:59 stop:466 length:408 start_codon:yes stop_codon:yes gene_type:complete
MKFTTELKQRDIYFSNYYKELVEKTFHLNPRNKNKKYLGDDIIDVSFKIDWEFYTEYREWGVKDIGCYATSICGEAVIEYWDEDDSDLVEETITINSEEDGWTIENKSEDIIFGISICPQELEVDYDNKILTVIY